MLAKISAANKIIFLGGGTLSAKLITFCLKHSFEMVSITSKRHLASKIDPHRTLEDFLGEEKINFRSLSMLNENSLKKIVGDMENGLAITLGAPWKISRGIIETVFNKKILNCHGTRLPTYRGGAQFSWNILRGNRLGLCLLQVLNETDTGDIVCYEEFVYPWHCRVPMDYERYYVEKNYTFISEFLLRVKKGDITYAPIKQSEYFSSVFPRLDSNLNSWINWEWRLEEIERFICAFDEPYAGALTTYDNQIVRIKDVLAERSDGYNHPFQSGLVYRNNGKWLMVCCGDGELIINKVLDRTNVNIVPSIRVGERFITPAKRLDVSKTVIYFTPSGASRGRRGDPLSNFGNVIAKT